MNDYVFLMDDHVLPKERLCFVYWMTMLHLMGNPFSPYGQSNWYQVIQAVVAVITAVTVNMDITSNSFSNFKNSCNRIPNGAILLNILIWIHEKNTSILKQKLHYVHLVRKEATFFHLICLDFVLQICWYARKLLIITRNLFHFVDLCVSASPSAKASEIIRSLYGYQDI